MTPIPEEENQRNFERILVNKSFKVVTSDGQTTKALLKDISLGGARLIWEAACQANDTLTIHFSTDLFFDAQVRWCEKRENHFDIGLQFEDLDPVTSLYFGEYLHSI